MIDTHLKMQLEKATVALDKTADIEGILIVAIDGRILHHNLRVDVDINLFGPMSQVISNSSHRLLNSSGQGDMERVLVESSGGKALFLGLENAHLIVLMQDSANVGMVMVNAKRASEQINEATHDLELEVPEEVPVEEVLVEEVPVEDIIEETLAEEITVKETPAEEITIEETVPEEIPVEKTVPEGIKVEDASLESISTEESIKDEMLISEEISAKGFEADEKAPEIQEESAETVEDIGKEPAVEPIVEPVSESTEEPIEDLKVSEISSEPEEVITEPETVKAEPETIETETIKSETETVLDTKTIEEKGKTEEAEVKETGPSIPTVRPPISFPTLPDHVEVPDDLEKRSDLILEIYEKIFLAMSMGAAKIMGVAPARGLTKKFLPFEKCQRLLHNVNLKSNATIDFAQIKKNAEDIPVPEREEIFIQDFSRMIEIITENYGRVMGYEAFRGMVRAEFLAIKKSYGEAMDELNIKKNMHPEIAHLFS
jgi:predicted regulator of Ras-like GTPase activity (Roadblock/LC7/MglB family)